MKAVINIISNLLLKSLKKMHCLKKKSVFFLFFCAMKLVDQNIYCWLKGQFTKKKNLT